MKFFKTAVLTLAAAAMFAPSAHAQKLTVDAEHSYVGFNVTHALLTQVKGKFREFNVDVTLDQADITKSTLKVSIPVKSIYTGVTKRDDHLRSADFFDVEKFPEIKFVSKKITKTGSTLQVAGDLTIKGVTKQVVLPLKLAGPQRTSDGGVKIGVSGRLVIKRSDFGMTWNTLIEGVNAVGDEVEIEVNAEAAGK